MIYDKDGVYPDPEIVKVIKERQSPGSIELQELLEIITYIYIRLHSSSDYQPAKSTKERLRIRMDRRTSTTFWENKRTYLYRHCSFLICFDLEKETVMQVDASGSGLGAVLIQNEKPITIVSKPLSETEQRYANFEREVLSVVFGFTHICERFHTYMYCLWKTFHRRVGP